MGKHRQNLKNRRKKKAAHFKVLKDIKVIKDIYNDSKLYKPYCGIYGTQENINKLKAKLKELPIKLIQTALNMEIKKPRYDFKRFWDDKYPQYESISKSDFIFFLEALIFERTLLK